MMMLSSRFEAIWIIVGFAAFPNTIKPEHNHWMAGCSKCLHNRASQGKQRLFGPAPCRCNHDRRRPSRVTPRVNNSDEPFSPLVLVADDADSRLLPSAGNEGPKHPCRSIPSTLCENAPSPAGSIKNSPGENFGTVDNGKRRR